MERRIVCIEASRDINYIVHMVDEAIIDIIYVPHDYKAKEIIDLIHFLIPISSLDDIICYDANGLGMMISDVTINNKDYRYKENMKPLKIKNIENAAMYLDEIKNKLNDLGKNLYGLAYVEFNKLCKEIDNLEYKLNSSGKIKLSKKDNSIGHTRVRCLLNAYYVLKNN